MLSCDPLMRQLKETCYSVKCWRYIGLCWSLWPIYPEANLGKQLFISTPFIWWTCLWTPTMAPSVAHLHAWATHNSPPTSKKNRVSHSHNCVFLSGNNTDTCIRAQAPPAFGRLFMPSCLCNERASFSLFLFYTTCLNKRASRCKNTAVVEECFVCLLSESEDPQGPSVEVQRLARGYGLSVLQCEQPRQINVRHVQRQAWRVHRDGRSPSGPCLYTTGGLQTLWMKRNWAHIKAFLGFLKWLIFLRVGHVLPSNYSNKWK